MWLALLLSAAPEAAGAAAEAAAEVPPPLIDVDGTIFIEFGFFLLMLIVLHHLVFKPYLTARAEREDGIDGERKRAQEMEASATAKIAEFHGRLEMAKQSGIGLRNEARQK